MSKISPSVVSRLTEIVGEDRISTLRRERTLYSVDIGAMPKLVSPFVPAGRAGAVVRPANEAQLIEIVKLANKEKIEIVPRAMATSGYGGVLPKKGALVVDLNSLTKVLAVDTKTHEVRTQAAAIWEQVDRHIKKQGLTLRVYPSSYPSSTVGGWLAQGGSGFGSFEYGEFIDNVVSARVVLPSGEVREFSGAELREVISEAEGITGIITELSFLARPLEDEVQRLISFPDAKSLQATLEDLKNRQVPIWSITFLNPASIKLNKLLPHRHSAVFDGENEGFEPDIPETYVGMFVYPESRALEIETAFCDIIRERGGVNLGPEAAAHEWEQHTAPMKLKRIGPSIVPTEVIVPLSSLGAVLDEIDEKLKQPIIIEGMSLRGDQVVLLGFIPHDERSLAFNFAFALSLSVIKIAKAHGGKAFSTGLYFRAEADSVLGKKRLEKIKAFKNEVDKNNILNPGKVIGYGLIDMLMGAAQALEPVIRPFANAAKPPSKPHDTTKEVRGIPGDVALMAYACARCGYCVPTCEQYTGRGWESHSPRGKYLYLREVMEGREKWDRQAVDTMLLCTTCEVCDTRCQLRIPIEHNWMTMRGKLIHEEKRGTFPPFEMMAAALEGENNIWAGKRENRANWVPEDMKDKLKDEGEIMYFAGCTASHVEHDIAEASTRLLSDAGYDLCYMGNDEACCGIPMKMAGKWDLFEEIYERNVAEAKKRGVKTVVTSCPACALVWKREYPAIAAKRGDEYDFEVKHYSELVAPAIADGRLKLQEGAEGKITFHDSCHLGRAQGIYEEPREMLKGIPGIDFVEMEHNREEGPCCGSVLTLVGEMPVAPILGGDRLSEAVDVGANKVVAACPCCQVQLRDSVVKNDLPLVVDDLARIVAQAAGYDIPSSSDNSLYMWGYFERFIVLMEPEQMAKLMEKIYPQMLDNMPPGMKPMMMGMRHVPGGLAMMEKMMPALFPILAPSILDKVMPDMIAAVQDYIGKMPDDMEELMPELLPKTMDALMPTYLPELIPFLVPTFIDFVRKGAPDAEKLAA